MQRENWGECKKVRGGEGGGEERKGNLLPSLAPLPAISVKQPGHLIVLDISLE